MPDYIGRDDLHFCVTNERIVLLDVAADSYMCLDSASTVALLPLIRSADSRLILGCDDVPKETQSIIDSMVQRGLLVESADVGSMESALYQRGQRPVRALTQFRRPRAQYAHLHGFMCASTRASLQLRCRPFASMLGTIRSRKKALAANASHAPESHLARMVERFDSLRPLYPRPYLCLFDSLAMLEWLLRHGIVAQWVFGVRANPFEAHCWLQMGDLVLNNPLDNAREFEPIMVV